MDKAAFLKKNLVSAMKNYADYLSGANLPKVDYSVLTDDQHLRYQLLAIGWDKSERVFSVIFHADIVDEHIWIQEDNSEEGLAALLLEKGISPQDIVLAYYPEYHRQYTDFAVA